MGLIRSKTGQNLAKKLTRILRQAPQKRDRTSTRGKVSGRLTGANYTTYVATLLECNESLPKNDKKTDAVLAALITHEFPDWAPWRRHVEANTTASQISGLRHYFNIGRLRRGKLPDKISFRYNEQGEPISGGKGRRVLTALEIRDIVLKYRSVLGPKYLESLRKNRNAPKALKKETESTSNGG